MYGLSGKPGASRLRRYALSSREVLRTVAKTALVVLTLVGLYLLFLLRRLVFTVFAAIVLASALRPLVIGVQRRLRLRRTVAVLALFALVVLALTGLLVAIVPSLVAGLMELVDHAGEVYARWYELALSLQASTSRLRVVLPVPPPRAQVEAWAAQYLAAARQSFPRLAARTGALLAELILGMALAFYWLVARDDLVRSSLRVLPSWYRPRFAQAFDEVERVLAAYLGGQLILALLVGGACLVAFVLVGLPHAGVLASLAGLLNVVPLVGATAAAVPAILVGGAVSPAKGLATAAAILLIQQVENNILAPKLLEQRVGLNPFLVLVAFTAGAALGGVAGALVAVPVAGSLSILARYLLIEPAAARWTAGQPSGEPQAGAEGERGDEEGANRRP